MTPFQWRSWWPYNISFLYTKLLRVKCLDLAHRINLNFGVIQQLIILHVTVSSISEDYQWKTGKIPEIGQTAWAVLCTIKTCNTTQNFVIIVHVAVSRISDNYRWKNIKIPEIEYFRMYRFRAISRRVMWYLRNRPKSPYNSEISSVSYYARKSKT